MRMSFVYGVESNPSSPSSKSRLYSMALAMSRMRRSLDVSCVASCPAGMQ